MISHSEHFGWLLKIGTGWLGWTEDQTLKTRMSTIILAYRGRADMFSYIFGGKADEPSQAEEEPISQESILSIFRAMNAHPERARN